jgi:RNA polymerase sigma factor (TIGR02999 family)
MQDVTTILRRVRAGDETGFNELVTLLYGELHRIASHYLKRERAGHTLQTTALVHEAYLKLAGDAGHEFADRVHFLAVAARVMRQVLVDYARARMTKKRSGGAQASAPRGLTISVEPQNEAYDVDLLDLDAALEDLGQHDETLARLIEMRYFGGMTAEETAEALGESVHVIRHDLRLAQAWMRRKLSAG